MNLRIGMYIRYYDSFMLVKIAKIVEKYNGIYFLDNSDALKESEVKNVIQMGFSITDVLETGDIIEFKIYTSLETSGVLSGITNIENNDMINRIKNDKNYKIISVITREYYAKKRYVLSEDDENE